MRAFFLAIVILLIVSCMSPLDAEKKIVPTPTFEKAIKENIPDLCLEIQDTAGKDDCLERISMVHHNPVACEKITDSSIKIKCYYEVAQVVNEIKYCSEIPEGDYRRNGCFIYMARTHKDYKMCGKIKDRDYRDNCYEDVAFKLFDENICLNIPDLLRRDKCTDRVFSVCEYDTMNYPHCKRLDTVNV